MTNEQLSHRESIQEIEQMQTAIDAKKTQLREALSARANELGEELEDIRSKIAALNGGAPRSEFICNKCGIEKSNARALAQHKRYKHK